jgi:hypothetical protein
MVTVRVVHQNSGKPASRRKVALGINGLLSGGVTSREWTDSKGEAYFEIKPSYGKVYVDGAKKYEGHLSGRMVVYI